MSHVFEPPYFMKDEQVFNPIICPVGGNTVFVKPSSDIEFDENVSIIWDIDFDIGDCLKILSDDAKRKELEAQVDSAINLVLPKYASQTLGVCLFKGDLQEVRNLYWTEELEKEYQAWIADSQLTDLHKYFLTSLLNEALYAISLGLPENVERFAFIKTHADDDLAFYILSSKSRFEQLHVFWNGPETCLADFVWDKGVPCQGYISQNTMQLVDAYAIPMGICIPSIHNLSPQDMANLNMAIEYLKQNNILFRPVPEENIAQEWQGLDTLIINANSLSAPAKRQLAGFCAAGGTPIILGNALGLPNEIGFSDYINKI